MIWFHAEGRVRALDSVTGVTVRDIKLRDEREVRLLAADTGSDSLWLATANSVLWYDELGELSAEFRVSGEEKISALATDENQGVWIAQGTQLIFVNRAGEAEFSLEPLGPESPIRQLFYDKANHAVLVLGRDQLAHVGAEGWILDHRELAQPATSLALVPGAPDAVAPMVKMKSLTLDTHSRGDWLEVELQYHDLGSGIRKGSAVFLIDGSPAEASCTYRFEGATCLLRSEVLFEGVPVSVTVEDQLGNLSPLDTRNLATVESQKVVPPEGTLRRIPEIQSIPGCSIRFIPQWLAQEAFAPTNLSFRQEIDSIDTSSGNLTLNIPIGQRYEVGAHLSYQIQAVNNSNAWDHIRSHCPDCQPALPDANFALTNPNSNAGVGWELHFGKLYSPQRPTGLSDLDWVRWPGKPGDPSGLNNRWLYVAPDGAKSSLHKLAGRNNGTSSLPVRYSKNGSFLRLRQVNANTVQIQQPDGLYSIFKKTKPKTGDPILRGRSSWLLAIPRKTRCLR